VLKRFPVTRHLQTCHYPADGHEGYGFPIGGVAATDYEDGVISPGGVGYDINCGVRLLSTTLSEKDVRPKLAPLAEAIFRNVPSGLGSRRKDLTISNSDLEHLVTEGVQWLIDRDWAGRKMQSTAKKTDT